MGSPVDGIYLARRAQGAEVLLIGGSKNLRAEFVISVICIEDRHENRSIKKNPQE
jgi:hypothetical protein